MKVPKMKFRTLKSIAHNLADSYASGISLLLGEYEIYLFDEAASAPEGQITVDFLAGTSTGSPVSAGLARIIARGPQGLKRLCDKHGCSVDEFKELTVRFGTDPVQGRHFTVALTSFSGKTSRDRYLGSPGRALLQST
ncbi:hypothetical protein [Maricaulis sp.]|uniref:hypothetical protein n=1 Tax=Maricaulis sp. TaxID=1486257 RepID=UPI000C68E899|nr:hypothetical protein [Maricaulis sp.]MAC89772.1 hypothetical protein [Maricaulis sp.]